MTIQKLKYRYLKNNSMNVLSFLAGIAVEAAVVFILIGIAYFICLLGFRIFS